MLLPYRVLGNLQQHCITRSVVTVACYLLTALRNSFTSFSRPRTRKELNLTHTGSSKQSFKSNKQNNEQKQQQQKQQR